jgi:TolB-like protein/DNA-binding winged helix-turn-helix (wHTH) protein/Flp pilus assembly protein TadD
MRLQLRYTAKRTKQKNGAARNPIMSADLRLGDWIVRPQRRIIERDDESIHVKPKSMSVFECLVAANGEPVSRNELFDTVWPGGEVSDDTLTQCIVELRKAFHDSARESSVIETIPKLGFRLVLPAEPLDEEPRPGKVRKLRLAGLALSAVMLIFGAMLSFNTSRLWLTEAGITLYMKTAAVLSPYSLEQKPGIAVLPFVNMSSDPENEYLSDGMSEEVINALARINRLPVIARTSSFQFKGQNTDVKEIGRLLGVTHVLEGSVRKWDESIRLTVQLIDAATGTHIWSGVYQRQLSHIFVMQNEITTHIVDQIAMALGDEIAPLPNELPTVEFMKAHPTSNLEAYELYLKGVQMATSTSPALIEQAGGYFDRAIALDENYADAWAAKGRALHMLGRPNYGHPHIPASVYPDAIAAFRRALEIDPGHAFAMGWLGVALMQNDYQWVEGMRMMEKSLARNPNDAALLAAYGWYLDSMQLNGADEVVQRAFRLDPYGIIPIVIRALQLRRDGRLLDAAALIETSLIGDREGYAPNYYSAVYNMAMGRLDAAEQRLQKARQVAHPVDLTLDALRWAIDYLRGKSPLPLAEGGERIQTERLSGLSDSWKIGEWADEQSVVAVIDLAIEQRHSELISILFSPKPPLVPEAEWVRIKDITGVTEFQRSDFYNERKSGQISVFK